MKIKTLREASKRVFIEIIQLYKNAFKCCYRDKSKQLCKLT